MNRRITGLSMIIASLLAVLPGQADAQLSARVQLYWEWGDRGWRSYEPAYAHARDVVYYEAPRPIRVPPGHLPPPGYCRLWYPGRPPGHQPAPQPCGRLFRSHAAPGAVILGAPAYHEVYGRGDWYDDRDDRYYGEKRAKKNNKGWKKANKKKGRGW